VVSSAVFIGIDVACALNKKLPICAVSADHPPLTPQAIPTSLSAIIPRGVGNKEIPSAAPFHEAARDVAAAINRIIKEMSWTVIGANRSNGARTSLCYISAASKGSLIKIPISIKRAEFAAHRGKVIMSVSMGILR
jgi:hypothetical protein